MKASNSKGLNVMTRQLAQAETNLFDNTEAQEARFNRAVKYWSKTFAAYQQDNKVIVGLYENNTLLKTELTTIIDHLVKINMINVTVGVHYMPNPTFVSIEFDKEKDTEEFIKFSELINKKKTIVLKKQDQLKNVRIIIDKLSFDLIEKFISPVLERWGKIIEIKTESIIRPDGKKLLIGQSIIEFLLEDHFTVEDLPYFIKVFNVKIFLHIRGKKKICFRCNAEDHLVSACPLKFCGRCRGLKPIIGHACLRSYAQLVAGSQFNTSLTLDALIEDENLQNASVLIDSAPLNFDQAIGVTPDNDAMVSDNKADQVDEFPKLNRELKLDSYSSTPPSSGEVLSNEQTNMSVDSTATKRSSHDLDSQTQSLALSDGKNSNSFSLSNSPPQSASVKKKRKKYSLRSLSQENLSSTEFLSDNLKPVTQDESPTPVQKLEKT